MELKTKQYTLSPQDRLPNDITDPKELIKKITRKVTINSKATNLNNTFPWVNLAEKTLYRYSDFDDKLIIDLQYNLARVLVHKLDYIRAEILLKNTIKKCLKQDRVDKDKLSECYYCMALNSNWSEDYENAKTYVLQAMDLFKNIPRYHLEYARILFSLNEIKEAKNHYKKALEISINKNGKEHPATISIQFHYGLFLAYTGRKNIAKKYLNNICSKYKNIWGEENLYTLWVYGHISNLLYLEKKYAEAFEKVKIAFSGTKNILGNDNSITLVLKTNCSKMLLKMKKYDEAIDYLENPFVLTDNKESMLLLAYDKSNMSAPEVFISKKGSIVLKILKTMERKNIPIIKNTKLVNSMIKNCNEFEPIPDRYYKPIAEILGKIIKSSGMTIIQFLERVDTL
ncbi:MAG: EscU/YscU/HrcU family type III secretion system export apparatus switch protein [Spirochaetaceae bacterium]|nr:EscU/YscU/HrcU family type III secretion system export apparatus switch protein [Spirochaetaceae bacterium]